MNPLVWGPSFWFVLHTVSLNYPDTPSFTERRTHYDFYHIVRNILPCEMCRQHYRELLEQYPIEPFLGSRASLVTWVITIHNQVNERLGKPMMERDDVLRNYQQVYARGSFCDPACPNGTGVADGNTSGGLSTGSKVMFGVGVTTLVIALLVLVIVVLLVRRRMASG